MLRKEIGTVRLDFGEGDWIDVRSERKYGNTVVAQRAAASNLKAARRKGPEAAAQLDFDAAAFNLALLVEMIVAWSDPEPINEDTVQELPNDIVQEVLDAITEGRPEDEQDPLAKNSSSPSEKPEASSESQREPDGPEA